VGTIVEEIMAKRLLEINKIQTFLRKHPIGFINEDMLIKMSLPEIREIHEQFKDDLIPKEGEI